MNGCLIVTLMQTHTQAKHKNFNFLRQNDEIWRNLYIWCCPNTTFRDKTLKCLSTFCLSVRLLFDRPCFLVFPQPVWAATSSGAWPWCPATCSDLQTPANVVKLHPLTEEDDEDDEALLARRGLMKMSIQCKCFVFWCLNVDILYTTIALFPKKDVFIALHFNLKNHKWM